MTRRAATLWLAAALAVGLLLVAIGGARLRAAGHRATDAAGAFELARADAERVLTLRSQTQTVAAGLQPQQDVFQRVNRTITAAGLRGVGVRSVTPAGDRALEAGNAGGPARRAQSVRIVLGPITLDELGAFLVGWRRDQPLWTVSAVDLGSPRDGSYQATLTASAVYVADAADQGSTP